jgi:glutathione S-transferase
MTEKYQLYGTPGSGSFAVQVALEESGAPYERIWVGQEAAEMEKYRAINPTGRVPALRLPNGAVMFESAAMLIHIANTAKRGALAPAAGTAANAIFLQWMLFLSANVYEAVLRIYYSARFSTRGDADAAAIRGRAIEQYCAHLALVNERLGPHVLGPEYSLADPYLYMLVGWYPDDKAGLWSRFPKLAQHTQLIGARPAVQKVEADHAR